MDPQQSPELLNPLSYKIIGAAIEVHSHLGPGLMESVYRTCLIEELKLAGMNVAAEQIIPIAYKGKVLEGYYRVDVIVNDTILVELKSVETVLAVHKSQVLSYLRLTGKPMGLLINFNVPQLSQGVTRLVNGRVLSVSTI